MLKAAILSNRIPRLIQCGTVGLSVALMILPPRVIAQGAKPTREQVLRHLDKMRERQPGMWNVAPLEGEYLSNLVQKLKAQRVLEIGTSNGYSAIWLALGLRETGQLITLEINPAPLLSGTGQFQSDRNLWADRLPTCRCAGRDSEARRAF